MRCVNSGSSSTMYPGRKCDLWWWWSRVLRTRLIDISDRNVIRNCWLAFRKKIQPPSPNTSSPGPAKIRIFFYTFSHMPHAPRHCATLCRAVCMRVTDSVLRSIYLDVRADQRVTVTPGKRVRVSYLCFCEMFQWFALNVGEQGRQHRYLGTVQSPVNVMHCLTHCGFTNVACPTVYDTTELLATECN